MRKILYLILVLILIISNCAVNNEGTGYLTVKTPELITVPNKSININNNDGTNDIDINPLSLKPSFFRYVLTVETKDGRRVKTEYFKNNDERVIDVPAGVSLNFFVGVYIAIDENSFTERFNTFILSDVKENIILMPNETKLIEFNLDLTKTTKVRSYYGTDFTGPNISKLYSVLSTSTDYGGNPVFTILPLTVNRLPDRTATVKYVYSPDIDEGWFENLDLYGDFPILGKYTKIFGLNESDDPSSDRTKWLISQDKIYRLNDIDMSSIGDAIFGFDSPPPITSDLFNSNNNLIKTKRVISVSFESERFYYFLDYGAGFLGFNYGLGTVPNWSSVENIIVNFTSNKIRQYPLLIDMQKDNGTENIIVLTKLGAFYSKEEGLQYLSEGDYIKGINSFKKIINISDENKRPILITGVISTVDRNYIATRKGLYYIDKNSSYWKEFVNANPSNVITLDSGAFTKLDDLNDEMIDRIFLIIAKEKEILIACTPTKILFKNLTNGKKDYLTLNDGLLFIPVGKLLNIVDTNEVDFISYRVAPVVDVILKYQNNNEVLFIATRFGLSSIYLNQLNIW